MEVEVQKVWAEEKTNEVQAPVDYSQLSKEEKANDKYMVTFPYPYMNGQLHLGHGYSMSKAEFSARYQKQRGKNSLFPFGFHCTGMPIQGAANRLRRELESGKIHSEQPKEEQKVEEVKKEEEKKDQGKAKGKGKKDDKAAKKVVVPPTQYEILQSLEVPEEMIE
jgi:leucyl-tRNA synthetase